MESLRPGVYRHLKTGGEYRVVCVGKGQFDDPALDMTDMVTYEALGENPISKYWTRPLADFISRFEFVREA